MAVAHAEPMASGAASARPGRRRALGALLTLVVVNALGRRSSKVSKAALALSLIFLALGLGPQMLPLEGVQSGVPDAGHARTAKTASRARRLPPRSAHRPPSVSLPSRG